MGLARDLGVEFIESEIEKIKVRLILYKELYQSGKIKCITLNRLIDSKERELKILEIIYKESAARQK